MNNIKKIGLLLLVLVVMTGFTQAAKEEKPDATLRLSGKSVAAGIGFSWGKGTLTYKGKDYPVSVKGLALGKVGISGVTAAGKVYNLKAGGGTAIAMKNQNGVRVLLHATTRGVDLTIGGAGVDMAIKK